MPTDVPIPINVGANLDVDEVGLVTHGAKMMDAYVDIAGSVNRRPGLDDLVDLGTAQPIDGLYWWDRQEWCIAVSDGEIYKITAADGTNSQIAGDALESGTRVTFGDYGTQLYAANGAKIVKIPTSGSAAYAADVDAPTTVTHLGVLDKYLIANEVDTEKFWFTVVSEPDNWDSDWAAAEGRTDLLKALMVSGLELNLMGTSTLEVWRDDGSTPFVRDLQGLVTAGTVAPYSFTDCDGVLYWLDQSRQAVRLRGRSTEVISLPMNKYIQGFASVSDAIGDFVMAAGRPYWVLQFPTEDKTICYDIVGNGWTEWGKWDSGTATYSRFRGNCFALCPAWNKTLVGDNSTGKIYAFSNTAYDDAGDTLRSFVRTPSIDHGTVGHRKFSSRLVFRLKRSNVVSTASATSMTVRWRDNGSTTWNTERSVSLSQVGDTSYIGELRRMGEYYSRQYDFILSDDTPLVLASVKEDFEYGS
jgi:hypothetical protein